MWSKCAAATVEGINPRHSIIDLHYGALSLILLLPLKFSFCLCSSKQFYALRKRSNYVYKMDGFY